MTAAEPLVAPFFVYLEFAGDDLNLWRDAIPARVFHKRMGLEIFSSIRGTAIEVEFDTGECDVFARTSKNITYIALVPSSPATPRFSQFVRSGYDGSDSLKAAQDAFKSQHPVSQMQKSFLESKLSESRRLRAYRQ